MGEKKYVEMENKKSEELMKKVHVSETEGPRMRGRPVGRWKDRVKEYTHESVCDRERWRFFCSDHPLCV